MLEARGASMSECAHAVGVGRATYYRWRQQYAGIKRKQAPKVRELEREIARLRSAIKGIERGK